MRTLVFPLLLWAASLLAAQPPDDTTVTAPGAADLHLVTFGEDLDLREALIASGRFYGDLGGRGIVALDAETASRLAERVAVDRLPPLRPGEVLLAIARDRAGIGPMHGRLLLARRAFFLMAALPSELPEDCRGSGFHGGLQVVTLEAPYAPARVQLPAGRNGSPEAAGDPAIAALVAQVQQPNLENHVRTLSNIFTRRANRPENAQGVSYVTGQLATLPNITYHTEVFDSRYGPNVIAELPGTDLAHEIVMVGAHLDSIVGGSSTARSPGADDNASGSAAVLEIARIFATQKFRRTVRFGWWNAEEFGLVGSNAYAAAARSRGDAIVAYVNTDMNAYRAPSDPRSVDYVTNDSTPSLITLLSNATQTYVPTLPVNVGSLSGGTSDHRSFFRNGFPAAFPFEDVGNYSPYIHTSNDTVGTSANDFELSKLITQSIVAGLAELAELDVATPGRFQEFGQGCPGTGTIPSVCAAVNPAGGTLDGTTRDNEYAYAVPHTGTGQVTAFEVFTRSTTGGNVTVGAYLYADTGGLPGAAPLASTTVTVGPTAGFYTATFAQPVPVSGPFHIAIDHSAQTTLLANLTSGALGIGSWRRPPLGGTWAASGLIDHPSFKVHCGNGTNNAVPEIGNVGVAVVNRSFTVTLEHAAANAPAALVIGFSNQVFAGGSLPWPLPGAPACDLLVSPDVAESRTTDANGAASHTFLLPNYPDLIGRPLFHQWAVIDLGANPLGVAVSGGAQSTIGG